MAPPSSLALLGALALLLRAAAAAAAYTPIAQQGAADPSPSWFDGLPTYHVPTSAVPASPAVPASAPARDMVFGVPLAFSVLGVNPASSFQLTLTFLDDYTDSRSRVQALSVGGVGIGPSFTLAAQTVDTRVFNVSAASVTPLPGGQHALAVSLASLVGPNAILSSFVLASSNPADPPLRPPVPPLPSQDLPRLTPRPLAVPAAGAAPVTLDLMGTWDFCAAPSAQALASLGTNPAPAVAAPPPPTLPLPPLPCNWTTIDVPGEYTLQGFRVPAGQPVLYSTTFTPPAAWGSAGLRVKLRFDGVSSNASVYLNNVALGGHLGGFTPFEVDLTPALLAGAPNALSLIVTGASLADTLASASQYASHDLGGITRKLYLLVVPEVSLAGVHVVSAFPNASYTSRAEVAVNVSLANDGASASASGATVTAVLSFNGTEVARGQAAFPAGLPGGGSVAYAALALTVPSPALWDPEHPRLHDLTLTLAGGGSGGSGGGVSEVVALRVGLRDVALAGNRILVNGRPIKARGTTRHETHPLAGRSLWALPPAGGQWARDIAAFRDANVNYIRTSHYPPPEELMQAADELGMLVEVEMPFCWASGNTGEAAFNYTVSAQREATVANRNFASVILWSLGNESPWTPNFAHSLSGYLRSLDGTRPYMFDGGDQQPIPPLDVLSVHYPSFDGPTQYANASQPTLFGEYAHLNCYNRRELAADPGVRDIWGLGIEHMWELIWASEGVLGACYWAGIDDYFYMPSGKPVGYGEWGVLDAWRRPKPETFLVRNIYSPVKLSAPAPGAPSLLPVDNRFDFTDLAEVGFTWALGSGESGTGSAQGAPRATGLTLQLHGLPTSPSGTLLVNASSPRGFLINAWAFDLGSGAARPALPRFPARAAPPPTVQQLADGSLLIQGTGGSGVGAFAWTVSPSGSLAANSSAGGALLSSGPVLMVLAKNGEGGTQMSEDMPPILPFTDPLPGWAAAGNLSWTAGGVVEVRVGGAYSGAAAGGYVMSFDGTGGASIAYNFTWSAGASISPRQVGLVFTLPPALQWLSWRRTPQWAAPYPSDHIGRAAGDGVAANVGPPPTTSRGASWSSDASEIGGADFRATRHNCSVFELGAGPGGSGGSAGAALAVVQEGPGLHGRAWVDGTGVRLLAAQLSNEGANPFSRERVLPNPVVARGDGLQGVVQLQLGGVLAQRA